MAKTEDIEAKLAAYVDGELDAAGRAEIEKHLSNNAQHRRLIRELIQHRDLLKNLPREMAPAEVCETINAQLERAVLLGDVDAEAEAVSMRIGPWHQIRTIAAVLVLTASLAAVIALLLPSMNSKPATIADVRALPPVPESRARNIPMEAAPVDPGSEVTLSVPAPMFNSDARATPAVDELEKHSDVAKTMGEVATAPMTEQQRRASLALNEPIGGGLGNNGMAAGTAMDHPIISNVGSPTERMFSETLADEMNLAAAKPEASPLVLLVKAEDPASANQEVTQYLTRNDIQWEAQSEPMPQAMEIPRSQAAYGTRFKEQIVRLKNGGDALAGATTMPGQQQAQASSPNLAQGQLSIAGGAEAAADEGALDRSRMQFRIVDRQANSGSLLLGPAPVPAAANAMQGAPESNEKRIVARQVSSEQLTRLRDVLSEIERNQSAAEVTGDALAMGPTTMRAASGSNFITAAGDGSEMLRQTARERIAGPATSSSNPGLGDRIAADKLELQSPTTLPSLNVGGVLGLSVIPAPLNTRGPVFRQWLHLDTTPQTMQAPMAQQSPANSNQSDLSQASGRVDVVIVVQPQVATTQPSGQPTDTAPATAPAADEAP